MRHFNFLSRCLGYRSVGSGKKDGFVTAENSPVPDANSLTGQTTLTHQFSFTFQNTVYSVGVTRTFDAEAGYFAHPSFFINNTSKTTINDQVQQVVDNTPPASEETPGETPPDPIILPPEEGPIVNDIVYNWFGHAYITTGNGNDYISTNLGRDTIFSGTGNDTVFSGFHHDFIHDAAGDNAIDGGHGNDTIITGAGNDAIDGSDGHDSIHAGFGNNSVDGGKGNDTIRADSNDDLLKGGKGNDIIYAGKGNDTVYGGEGDDTVFAGGGDNHVHGEGGANLYDFTGTTAGATVIYDFVRGTDLLDIEGLTGGQMSASGTDWLITFGNGTVSILLKNIAELDFSDFVPFDGLEDAFAPPAPVITVIDGTDGADNLVGTEGQDSISAFLGNDTVMGLGGNDTLRGGDGNNTLDGGDGDDTIYGGLNNDLINGGAGHDLIMAGQGMDTINGGDGDDTIVFEFGNSVIHGDAGNDKIYARIGVDGLYGDAGNDTIFSGTGNDQLHGGADADVFDFSNTHEWAVASMSLGFDTIHDFVRGTDKLNIQGLTGGQITDFGSDVMLTFDQNTTIYLVGVGTLDINDFVYFDGLAGAMTF